MSRSEITAKVLPALRRIECMVLARQADGPFSTTLRTGRYYEAERITVLGVVMPDLADIAGEPTLRTMPLAKYHRILDLKELPELAASLSDEQLSYIVQQVRNLL